MKHYIRLIILEQINRARSLKKLIPYPRKYAELNGLAERCNTLLDEFVTSLGLLQQEIESRDENDLRDVLREVRMRVRDIAMVEYFGIPALYYETDEIGFFNRIMFKIHQELKLPFPNPSVCCISSDYYYSSPFTNTIFLPLGESEFLLHLVDIYHELGHYILVKMEGEFRLEEIKKAYAQAVSGINSYYKKLLKAKRLETGPTYIPLVIEYIHKNWDSWLDEFFCDLFALYSVGPAYAWSHMHLATKTSKNIHELSLFRKTSASFG